jgi:hypothetical protein
MYKFVTFIIVITILAVSLPVIFKENKSTSSKKKINTVMESKHADGFAWTYQTVENKDTGEIKTRVFLNTGSKKYDTGSYAGTCSQIKSSNLIEGEVSAVLCWYAGFGDEIGIFKDSHGYTIKHGEVQEGSGEDKGFRGNFVEILSF